MIKEIIRGEKIFARKAEDAVSEDIETGNDLRDTLAAHKGACIGMAANMIGVNKKIIIIETKKGNVVMYNPVIVKREGPFVTEEGCLSLDGVRSTLRFEKIRVEYLDDSWKKCRMDLSGIEAEACQHEIDHLAGTII